MPHRVKQPVSCLAKLKFVLLTHQIVGGTADTLPVIVPLAACKHAGAYPQVSGHLGGDQDPADKKEDISCNW